MSPLEYECDKLMRQVASGAGPTLGDTLSNLSFAFGSGYGPNAYNERLQRQAKQRLDQYKIALESYKALCK